MQNCERPSLHIANHILKSLSTYDYYYLLLPVNAHVQNMFSRHVKCLSFRYQTLKFSCLLSDGMEPRHNYLAMQSCSSSSSGVFHDKQKLPFLLIRKNLPFEQCCEVKLHIWAGKLRSLTPETQTFDVT